MWVLWNEKVTGPRPVAFWWLNYKHKCLAEKTLFLMWLIYYVVHQRADKCLIVWLLIAFFLMSLPIFFPPCCFLMKFVYVITVVSVWARLDWQHTLNQFSLPPSTVSTWDNFRPSLKKYIQHFQLSKCTLMTIGSIFFPGWNWNFVDSSLIKPAELHTIFACCKLLLQTPSLKKKVLALEVELSRLVWFCKDILHHLQFSPTCKECRLCPYVVHNDPTLSTWLLHAAGFLSRIINWVLYLCLDADLAGQVKNIK